MVFHIILLDVFIFHFRFNPNQNTHETEALENLVYEDGDKYLKFEASESGFASPPLPPPRNEKPMYKHSGDRESYIEMRSYRVHLPAGENIYDNPNDANPSLVIPNPRNIYPNAPLDTYKNLPTHYAIPIPAAAKEETTYENTVNKT